MNRIFLDTSAVIAVVRDEPSRPAILRVTDDAIIVAAASLPLEICNAMTAALKKRSATVEEASAALSLYQRMPIELIEIDIVKWFDVAARNAIYAYDAFVIATARRAGLGLLTLDRRMRQVAAAEGVPLVEISI